MRKKSTSDKKRRSIILSAAIIVTALSLVACGNLADMGNSSDADSQQTGSSDSINKAERVDTGFVVTGPDSYDSADTPILVGKNEDDKTVTFLNLDIGRRYTLSIDGTTKLYDKYGEAVSLDQIQVGDIVDVTFLKSKKHLTSMQLSANAWKYDSVERYEINRIRQEVTIGSEIYKLSDNTQYLSEGRAIEEIDLNPADVLSFQGIDSTVLSVHVEKGHGYLRLVNDENFVGGWIEIGQKQIQKITEDMLLTVPEGAYQVNISHNGGGGAKSVIINRNEETLLDIGDLTVAEAKYGMVLFSLNPSNAKLYIDGSEVDPSQPITLEYGIHQIIAKADGYKSLTQYLSVGQESAGIDVVLDAVDDEDDEDEDEESSSDKDAEKEDATTSYYKVYVDAPEGAEVYLDGNYVGISPCSFKKNAGSHVITLRQTGCETRSYTVQIDGEDKDISYSFADLLEAATVSGS
ncbi:MAG: PEGA domain-containing protein [Lachnospiraceae bacterium]|nr:PEGA domain-containing protein [Lachnospiraceae bacterium]